LHKTLSASSVWRPRERNIRLLRRQSIPLTPPSVLPPTLQHRAAVDSRSRFRLCVVRPPSSLFHLSYDLIMTIECGRRRHPGGFAHTRTIQRDGNKTRPIGSQANPLCPIDRHHRRRDLTATDRPMPDVKFRRQSHNTCIRVTFTRLIVYYTVAPPADYPDDQLRLTRRPVDPHIYSTHFQVALMN